jgi:hypothetical protein
VSANGKNFLWVNLKLALAKRLSELGMIAVAPMLIVAEDEIDGGKAVMEEALTNADSCG